MARLLESEAKHLLAEGGISVPKGMLAATPNDVVAAAKAIGFPVAIKAQLRTGKRAKAGAIGFAANAEEAYLEGARILGGKFYGQSVPSVLVEQRVECRNEFYLGVMSNPGTRSPVLIFSSAGGTEIEEAAATGSGNVTSLPVDILEGVRPAVALELLRQGGLTGPLLLQLSRVVETMYQIYRRYDCHLVEINPVAMGQNGPVALDARMSIDDDALYRHPKLQLEGGEEVGERLPTMLEKIAATIDAHDHRGSAHFVQIDPDGTLAAQRGKISIGFDGIGTGASLTTLDELVPLGFLPKNFCDTSGNPTASKLYRVTRIILSQPGIEGYVFVSCLSSQQLDNTARGIVKAFKEVYSSTDGQPNMPCVLSFRGAWDETAIAMFEEHGLTKSPWLKVLGRDSTERELALAFKELHARWRHERTLAA